MKVTDKDLIWDDKKISINVSVNNYSIHRAEFETTGTDYWGKTYVRAFLPNHLTHILNIGNSKLFYLK